MICPYCQHDISNGDKYCPSCGAKLSAAPINAKDLWEKEQDTNKTLYFLEETNKKADPSPSKKKSVIPTILAVVLCAIALGSLFILPKQLYNKANSLIAEGEYSDARTLLSIIKDYEDSQQLSDYCTAQIDEQTYSDSVAALNNGDPDTAIQGFESLPGYKDADLYLYLSQKTQLNNIAKRVDWKFSDSLYEMSGQPTTIYGNMYIKPVLNGITAATVFDGNDSYIETTESVGIGDNSTVTILLNCWNTDSSIVYEDNSGYSIYFNNRVLCVQIPQQSGNSIHLYSPSYFWSGNWYVVSITFSNKTATLYVNGSKEDEKTLDSDFIPSADTIYIGGSSEDSYYGYIADLSIYNSVLPTDTIQRYANCFLTLYDANKGCMEIPNNSIEWNGDRYAVFNNCNSWECANKFAAAIGGHLATLTSPEENYAIFNWLYSIGQSDIIFGLSDEAEEGAYKWVTNEPVEYTNWPDSTYQHEYDRHYAHFDQRALDGTWDGMYFYSNPMYLIEWNNVPSDYPL